jgi:hypothetical protein
MHGVVDATLFCCVSLAALSSSRWAWFVVFVSEGGLAFVGPAWAVQGEGVSPSPTLKLCVHSQSPSGCLPSARADFWRRPSLQPVAMGAAAAAAAAGASEPGIPFTFGLWDGPYPKYDNDRYQDTTRFLFRGLPQSPMFVSNISAADIVLVVLPMPF